MIQEIVQIQEIDILHIDPFVLDHFHFHAIHVKTHVVDIVIVIQSSILVEINHVQDTLYFLTSVINSRSPYSSSLRNNRYVFFSSSNSRNRQYFRNSNSLYRLPSRPRSPSASASGRFVNNVPPNSSEIHDNYTENFLMSKDKFEVDMYITKKTTAISPSNWFCNLHIHSQIETDSNLLSRLQTVFLLNSVAFIFVLIITTYTMITQMFNFCDHDQHDTSKTLTIANQSKTQLNINNKRSFIDQPRSAFFTTLIEKNLPFFSFFYCQINSKNQHKTSPTLFKHYIFH